MSSIIDYEPTEAHHRPVGRDAAGDPRACPSLLRFFVRLAGCVAIVAAWLSAAAVLHRYTAGSSANLSRTALPALCIVAAGAALALDIYLSRRKVGGDRIAAQAPRRPESDGSHCGDA